ncbi:MAG: O-antigen ligase family protein [Blastococcus sp.]
MNRTVSLPRLAGASVPERLAARGTAERAAVVTAAVSVALQPLLRPSGPLNSSPVDLALLLTVLVTAVWAGTSSVRLRAPFAAAVGLMVLGGAIAGLNGPLPGTSLITLTQDLVLFAWATAITNLARRPGVLRVLSTTWSLTSVVCAAVLVFAALFGWTAVEGFIAKDGNRASFTFGDPDYASMYWVFSVFIVYATQRPRRAWLRRLGYVLLIWSLVLTQSNGGLVALPVGAGLVLLVAAHRRFGTMAALFALLVTVASVGALLTSVPLSAIQESARYSGQPLLQETVGRSDASSSQRSTLTHEAMQLYDTDGPLGSGPGTTKELLTARHYAYAKEAHDDFLAALVERGLIGLVGILVLLVEAVSKSARVLRGPPHGWPELPRPVGLVAGLLAALLAGTYYEVLHIRYVWLLLALTAAVASSWPARAAGRADGAGSAP